MREMREGSDVMDDEFSFRVRVKHLWITRLL